ncbi:unnamed protein product [Penicillium salamii]|nr:unnamed protein product [Penicillium salamii]
MAAPLDVNIEHLNGSWVLALSSESDPILKLQKVSWLIRKAFSFATIYIKILQYPIKEKESSEPSTKIDFIQTASAGLAGSKEERILDWAKYDHTDYFFGTVKGQSQFIYGAPAKDGTMRPEFELQTDTTSAEIKQFLRGEIELDWSKSPGFLVEAQDEPVEGEMRGCWVHTFERNEKLGWTAEQIWGFEMIGESRYFSRRVVVMTTKGQYLCGRIVFDFVGLE